MADCKCGAPVTYARTDDNDMPIPLESFSVSAGERYVVVDYSSSPWVAERLDPFSLAEGHPDHRTSCPYQQ